MSIYVDITKKIRALCVGTINLYQRFLSPLRLSSCRFYPSCSEYTKLKIQKEGTLRGIYYGLRRIIRCHPFNPGGYDPA